jgi:hypothetical protein
MALIAMVLGLSQNDALRNIRRLQPEEHPHLLTSRLSSASIAPTRTASFTIRTKANMRAIASPRRRRLAEVLSTARRTSSDFVIASKKTKHYDTDVSRLRPHHGTSAIVLLLPSQRMPKRPAFRFPSAAAERHRLT